MAIRWYYDTFAQCLAFVCCLFRETLTTWKIVCDTDVHKSVYRCDCIHIYQDELDTCFFIFATFYYHVSGHKHTAVYFQFTWSDRKVLKFSSLLINEIGQIAVA